MLNRQYLITAVSGLLFGFAWFFHAAYAHSAPFCVEMTGTPAECWYYDITACQDNAEKKGGECVANLEQVRVSSRGAPICLLDQSMWPDCSYEDLQTCQEQASRKQAVCFVRPQASDSPQLQTVGQSQYLFGQPEDQDQELQVNRMPWATD